MDLYHVDAFTAEPFKGNPAAVCLPDTPLDAELMQKIAFEMNLSETAFLEPFGKGPCSKGPCSKGPSLDGSRPGEGHGREKGAPRTGGFQLRWFTPKVEVDLCGHATLASAHVLWETGRVEPGESIEFHTRSGLLSANENGGWIELNFPTEPPEASSPAEGLLTALGVQPLYVGKTRFDFFVETGTEEGVKRMQPDFGLLEMVPCRGVIVTAKGTDYDFVSRFFAPAVGVREDPVTGSAHCSLAPYWREKLGKDDFIAYQASERGGVLRVRAAGGRTFISGQAVTVLKGEIVRTGR